MASFGVRSPLFRYSYYYPVHLPNLFSYLQLTFIGDIFIVKPVNSEFGIQSRRIPEPVLTSSADIRAEARGEESTWLPPAPATGSRR